MDQMDQMVINPITVMETTAIIQTESSDRAETEENQLGTLRYGTNYLKEGDVISSAFQIPENAFE